MRLYLSSARMGAHPERLAAMAGRGGPALVVANAVDALAPDRRAARVEAEMAALRELGFQPAELDLREHFGDPDPARLEERLRAARLVWVRGGNSFVLLRAVRLSGLDGVLPRLLREDALVYGGYSAAISILTPSLRGVELVDDPAEVPPGYPGAVLWDGLGVLPYAVAPHFRSDHPESAATEHLVEYYIAHHVPFIALRDGEVIVREGAAAGLAVLGAGSP